MTCAGTEAVFAPDSLLQMMAAYAAAITAGVKDMAGNALQDDHAWSFITAEALVEKVHGLYNA